MNRTPVATLIVALSIVSSSRVLADEPPSPEGTTAPAAHAEQHSQPNWPRIAGIATVAVGGGFLALFNLSAVKVGAMNYDDRFQAYRAAHARDEDVCVAAAAGKTSEDRYVNDLCSNARTYEVLQIISAPIATVAITTGVLLIARSGEDEPTETPRRFDFVAGFRTGGGWLEAIGRF